MAINPVKIMQLRAGWEKFQSNHPRLVPFMKAAGSKVEEGAVIEMALVTPDGKRMETNLKVKPDDMELLRLAMETAGEKI